MTPDGDFLDLRFPLAGVDVSPEFDEQPPLTTPSGVNVRGYEPTTQRARGGSRCGLTRFLPATVGGAHPVQCLDLLARPAAGSALTVEDDDGAGGGNYGNVQPGDTSAEPDPSSNNRFLVTRNPLDGRNPGRGIRLGGSGVQPVRGRPRRGDSPANEVVTGVVKVAHLQEGVLVTYQIEQADGSLRDLQAVGNEGTGFDPGAPLAAVGLYVAVYTNFSDIGPWIVTHF